MGQATEPETSEIMAHPSQQPLVFLDTSVILEYLRGNGLATKLFSAEARGLVRFAVNPIVVQEILFATDVTSYPEFDRIRDHLTLLSVDFAKAEALLPKARSLRNRLVHSNDILILSSAGECDFLVTHDLALRSLATTEKPQIVSPEELVTRLRAA